MTYCQRFSVATRQKMQKIIMKLWNENKRNFHENGFERLPPLTTSKGNGSKGVPREPSSSEEKSWKLILLNPPLTFATKLVVVVTFVDCRSFFFFLSSWMSWYFPLRGGGKLGSKEDRSAAFGGGCVRGWVGITEVIWPGPKGKDVGLENGADPKGSLIVLRENENGARAKTSGSVGEAAVVELEEAEWVLIRVGPSSSRSSSSSARRGCAPYWCPTRGSLFWDILIFSESNVPSSSADAPLKSDAEPIESPVGLSWPPPLPLVIEAKNYYFQLLSKKEL